MIRYDTTLADIKAKVDPKWLAAAEKKTAAFRKAGKYEEKQGSWSEVKPVYMDLQHGKCAYCERQFGKDDKSRIEHDVEHFRPKSSVKAWPPKGSSLSYTFGTGDAAEVGYYLLPYNLLNYAVACKKCNSSFKSDYFPVEAATRAIKATTPAALAKELPLLIYPISDIDDDPAHLIAFEGLIPVPAKSKGRPARRAQVTIDFFALGMREELLRERALILKAIYVACEDLNHRDPLRRRDAQQTVAQIDKPGLPHRNCARAFHRLFLKDPDTARDYYVACMDYLDSVGG